MAAEWLAQEIGRMLRLVVGGVSFRDVTQNYLNRWVGSLATGYLPLDGGRAFIKAVIL